MGKSPARGRRPSEPPATTALHPCRASATRVAVPGGWLVLPLVAGPHRRRVDDASRPVQVVASIGLWPAGLAVLVATLVPTTVSLTALRVAAPAARRSRPWPRWWRTGRRPTTVVGPGGRPGGRARRPRARDGRGVRGRFVLRRRATPAAARRPVALLAGPRSSWLGGGGRRRRRRSPAAGGPAVGRRRCGAWPWGSRWRSSGVRSLHTLARRWLVFVPNGVVVHDPLALARPDPAAPGRRARPSGPRRRTPRRWTSPAGALGPGARGHGSPSPRR